MTKLDASAKSMFTCYTWLLYYIHDLSDTSPKVSSHFFDARRKKHRLSTISFCYRKEMCDCKQTGKQRWLIIADCFFFSSASIIQLFAIHLIFSWIYPTEWQGHFLDLTVSTVIFIPSNDHDRQVTSAVVIIALFVCYHQLTPMAHRTSLYATGSSFGAVT